jgi:hypothetical protein
MFFGNAISHEVNIPLSRNFQDILVISRPIYGQNLKSKYRHLIFLYIPYHRLKLQ